VLPQTRLCPRRSLTQDTWRWLDLYSHYKAGHLIEDGGLQRQPAKYLAAMRLIETTVSSANAS